MSIPRLADRCNIVQCCKLSLLQTQSYPLGYHCTLLCFPTSTAQFMYISTLILGYTWVYNIARARTRRWQDCSWPVVTIAVTYHIVLSTVQFIMTNVRLAWDKTRCHAFIVYHRTYFIAYHLHTCQWRNFQPERYDCDKYNQLCAATCIAINWIHRHLNARKYKAILKINENFLCHL